MHTSAVPSSRLFGDLRTLPRSFWILCAGMFINRLGSFVWPFLTIFVIRQGYSVMTAAVAVGSLGLGSALGGGVGGWLTDRFGRRHTIAAGSAAAAGAVVCLFLVHGLPAMLLCVTAWGLAGGTYNPAASALLADIIPEPMRVRAWSAYRLAINAGFGCGVALGGLLANYSFRLLFAGDAATTLAFAIIAATCLPHGLRGQTAETPWRIALGYLRRDRVLHRLLAVGFMATLLYMQFGTTYSLQILGLGVTLQLFGHTFPPETAYGLLAGWNGVMVTVCELPLTRWTQRWRPGHAMALGYLLLGGGLWMNLLMRHFGGFFFAMTVFTLGEMLGAPVSTAFLSRLAPPALRGRYMGVSQLAGSLAVVPAPLLGSALFRWSPAALWSICALIGLACAALVFRMGREGDGEPRDSGWRG